MTHGILELTDLHNDRSSLYKSSRLAQQTLVANLVLTGHAAHQCRVAKENVARDDRND